MTCNERIKINQNVKVFVFAQKIVEIFIINIIFSKNKKTHMSIAFYVTYHSKKSFRFLVTIGGYELQTLLLSEATLPFVIEPRRSIISSLET